MRKSRFTDSQILAILKQAEGGVPVPDLCREHGMSSATFYKWRSKFGGMDASMMARLKELEDENRRLKKMYAEERLKAEILKEAIEKKVVTPSRRREMAHKAVAEKAISIRMACCAFGISETCFRYQARLSTENAVIADWLLRLTQRQRNWGFGLCFLYLRNVKGFGWNHKRVYRIYRELELNLRIKPRKRLVREAPKPLSVPAAINECWSMDFMHDQLNDGRTFRLFNVLDDYSWEGLGIEEELSLPAERVIGLCHKSLSSAANRLPFVVIMVLNPSSSCRITQRAGYGHTITNGQIWPWVASHPDRSGPYRPDFTSESH